MKVFLNSKAFFVGILLIALTNLATIMGALGNRKGEPEAQIELTEREMNYSANYSRENSGVSLRLNVRHDRNAENSWLDQDKLETLGFSFPEAETESEQQRVFERLLPRAAYIVLEFDGTAYREEVDSAKAQLAESEAALNANPESEILQKRLESSTRKVERLQTASTRLYSINAGLDPVALRNRYPDRSKYIIAPGTVRPVYSYADRRQPKIKGSIGRVHVTQVHVPLQHRDVLDSLPAREQIYSRAYPPRFKVNLANGSRYEPWVESIEAL